MELRKRETGHGIVLAGLLLLIAICFVKDHLNGCKQDEKGRHNKRVQHSVRLEVKIIVNTRPRVTYIMVYCKTTAIEHLKWAMQARSPKINIDCLKYDHVAIKEKTMSFSSQFSETA